MEKPPYGAEQSHNLSSPEISILNMITYIACGGEASALLKLAGEVREVALALNSQNQLCYRDGNDLKLWPSHIALRLTVHSELVWKNYHTSQRAADQPSVERVRVNKLRLPGLAYRFNLMVEGLAELRRAEPSGKAPLFGPHLELVNEITVDFTLSRINGSAEVLASIYFNTIEQSINDCLIDLTKQGKRAGRIIAEGRVIKKPNVTRKLEERLNKRDYAFEIITEGLTFARYRGWRKSPHPVSSL